MDALINVPNLKHHPLAGFTGCLKSISHANDTIMEGPDRFHRNACNPYIADIYAIEAIRSKVRLQVMNSLVGIFDRGAYPPLPKFQWPHNAILLGVDPVALDAIGAESVDAARAEAAKRPVRRDRRALRYLETAAERRLGQCRPDHIQKVAITIDADGGP